MLPWLEQAYQASADSVRYFPAMAPATRPAWTCTWPTAGLAGALDGWRWNWPGSMVRS